MIGARPVNLGAPRTTIGRGNLTLPPELQALQRQQMTPTEATQQAAPPSMAQALGRSEGAAQTPTVESGSIAEALAAALEGGIHGRAAYRGQQREESATARALANETEDRAMERRSNEATLAHVLAQTQNELNPERWSDPYEMNGVQVQRNSRDNQVRPVSPPTPAGLTAWGPMTPEVAAQYPGLNPRDFQVNQATSEVRQIPGAAGRLRFDQQQRGIVQTAIQGLETGEDVQASIADARRMSSMWSTGFIGGMTREVPGSPSFNLSRAVNTIKANLGFQALQAMRDASPTGGALGQIAVQELEMLQAVVDSFDNAQSQEEFERALDRAEQYIARRAARNNRIIQAYQADVQAAGDAPAPQEPAPTSNGGPQPGAVEDGFRFNGGDPADPNNWQPVR